MAQIQWVTHGNELHHQPHESLIPWVTHSIDLRHLQVHDVNPAKVIEKVCIPGLWLLKSLHTSALFWMTTAVFETVTLISSSIITDPFSDMFS